MEALKHAIYQQQKADVIIHNIQVLQEKKHVILTNNDASNFQRNLESTVPQKIMSSQPKPKKYYKPFLPPISNRNYSPGLSHRQSSTVSDPGPIRKDLRKSSARIMSHNGVNGMKYVKNYGPSSYQPSQMHDYFTIRSIVNELVDEFLLKLFPQKNQLDNNVSNEAIKPALIIVDYTYLAPDIYEEIFLELIAEFINVFCEEITKLKKETISFFARVIQDVCGSNTELSEVESLLNKLIFNQPLGRNLKRNIHSMTLKNLPITRDALDNKSRILAYDYLHTSSLIAANIKGNYHSDVTKAAELYTTLELKYWTKIRATVGEYSATKESKLISAAKSSFDDRFLAIATLNGHLVIIDFFFKPPRATRYFEAVSPDEVIDISWNFASTQLVTLTLKGDLTIWSLGRNNEVEVNIQPESKVFKFNKISDRFKPQLLQQIFSLNTAYNDFRFFSGPLVQLSFDNNPIFPRFARFHPTCCYGGEQPSLIVALSNENILKCNLTDAMFLEKNEADVKSNNIFSHPPIIRDTNERKNKIGSDINVELFAWHKQKIIFIDFVNNCDGLITIDEGGNICVWNYNHLSVKAGLYFESSNILKIKLTKLTYVPNGNVQVLYSQQKSNKSEKLTLEQAQERIKQLSSTHDLWHHRISDDNSFQTKIYIPSSGVSDEGSECHVVTDSLKNAGRLQTYLTQTYVPFDLPSDKIVLVSMTRDGLAIVIGLLFPEMSPKESNLTVIIIDVLKLKITNLKIEIILSNLEYQACSTKNISCDVTRPIDPLGSKYLFLNIGSSINIYSLSTGQKVGVISDRKHFPTGFTGLKVEYNVSIDDKINVNIYRNLLFVNLTSTIAVKYKNNPCTLIVLRDINETAQITEMKETAKLCMGHLAPTALKPLFSHIQNTLADVTEVKEHLDTSIFPHLSHPVCVVRSLLDDLLQKVVSD